LLLPTGQSIGECVREVGKPDPVEQFEATFFRDIPRSAENVAGCEGDIVENREMRKQVVILEHDADARANVVCPDPWIADVCRAEPDLPVVEALEQVDGAQERRLP
jgi:hypothetical protein